MNFSTEELEKELAALRPVVPDPILRNRIGEALKEEEHATEKLISMGFILGLAMAACLALAILVLFQSPGAHKDASNEMLAETNSSDHFPPLELEEYEALEAEQRLIEAVDEGIVLSENNEPLRRLRYQFIDAVTLVNEHDGSVFRMEIPREELLYVPVTLL